MFLNKSDLNRLIRILQPELKLTLEERYKIIKKLVHCREYLNLSGDLDTIRNFGINLFVEYGTPAGRIVSEILESRPFWRRLISVY